MALVSARTYTTTNGDVLTSINRGPEFIPDYVGGKTGFDESTGYCLVEIGQRDDVQVVSVTIDGVAPDVWYQDHAILQDYAFAARADRIASGDPVGDNVVALAQESDQAPADESADEDATPPDTAFTGVETGPRPVLVTGTPTPIKTASEDHDGAFDNGLIGGLIAAIIAVSLLMRSGVTLLGRSAASSTRNARIDT
jgi:D-alanyl-D-alanine carboxypeptidase